MFVATDLHRRVYTRKCGWSAKKKLRIWRDNFRLLVIQPAIRARGPLAGDVPAKLVNDSSSHALVVVIPGPLWSDGVRRPI
jgi:hypothetical protein